MVVERNVMGSEIVQIKGNVGQHIPSKQALKMMWPLWGKKE